MTGSEIVQFSSVVFVAYNEADFETLLLGLDRSFPKLVTGIVGFQNQVQYLVGVANSQGWVGQLVTAVIKDRGHTQAIKGFLTNYPDWDPARNPPVADPSDAIRLVGGKYFIGRKDLRDFLKRLNVATDRKVLLITSEHKRVGKTYSRDLINFIVDHRQPAGLVYEDLDAGDYNPVKLAKKLGAKMKRDFSEVPDEASEQANRSNQELVTLLVPDPGEEPSKVWWIILDGFKKKVPSEPMQEFIAQLADRIQDRQDFRLLLIDYDYELPLPVDILVLKDKVKPLCEIELKEFLAHIHQAKKGNLPTPEKLDEYLKGVQDLHNAYIQRDPKSAQDQLLVNAAITQVAEEI
jgi:hypothetical protein